jgi:type II secretory pathway pseudopilin PulG
METEIRKHTKTEIIIIASILTLVAAIVIPQYSNAAATAKETELISALQKVRAQIALYRIQHDNLLPGQIAPGQNIGPRDFHQSLTTSDPEGLGPYLPAMPVNPFNEKNDITFINNINASPAGTEETAWWFNAATGEFRATDSQKNIQY